MPLPTPQFLTEGPFANEPLGTFVAMVRSGRCVALIDLTREPNPQSCAVVSAINDAIRLWTELNMREGKDYYRNHMQVALFSCTR